VLRRAADLALVILMLPVILVLGTLIAVAVFLDSAGPIFYRSVRVGQGGHHFGMLKFRKMRKEAQGPLLTSFEDQRLTPIGRFLQATRLDELPQFWHVIRGQMSLVGPRPELPEFVALHEDEYEEILSVVPGLTGLVQVQFIEESRLLSHVVDYEQILPEKVALDLTYVRRRGVGMDLAILARTLVLPFTVFWHRSVSAIRRTHPGHVVAYSVVATTVLVIGVAFAAQSGPIR
jgi:lipopolysaccharide/colanic/teichoic acid biosynthesis glycosyltransferase